MTWRLSGAAWLGALAVVVAVNMLAGSPVVESQDHRKMFVAHTDIAFIGDARRGCIMIAALPSGYGRALQVMKVRRAWCE